MSAPSGRVGLLAFYVMLVAVVAAAAILAQEAGVDLSVMTRDVFSIARLPVYAGVISNLGAFLWCAAAAVSLFAWFLTPAWPEDSFPLATAALSTMLLADDFWMFHEWIAPRFLGIREEIVLWSYGVLFVLYVIAYHRRIRAAAPRLFAVALALFVIDGALDMIEPGRSGEARRYLEDALKFFAIGTWLLYAATAARAALAGERGD